MLEFKVTRGSWSTVEVDRFGFDIPNRIVNLQEADTVYIEISAWKDRVRVEDLELTLKLDNLPPSTPSNADFYLAGDVNGWNASRNKYRFRQGDDGNYYLDIPRTNNMLSYKITRGSWDAVEVGVNGQDIPNRSLYYKDADTITIDIANWKDKPLFDNHRVTLVIDQLPNTTPTNARIYLAPDFNGWDPEDKRLIFNRLPDGRPYITVSGGDNSFEYKITRGGWGRVEVDQYGNEIADRMLNYGFADTVYIRVAGWRDFGGRY